ncbi:UvrD-helicase domain-containing protein [Thermodesulfobacteriota bacterium]
MIYFADLHLHSRYSIATSKDCNLTELAKWASLKGIEVLATGDFTHPQWSAEIIEMLEESGDGLFRLKPEHVPPNDNPRDGFGPGDVRFMLNVEISSIYKKRDATRKVHNLIHMPDIESMRRFNGKLDNIGNIKSDGRPILGLDSRDLLEIALEITPESFLIPAHIWTPWFSLLGSKSGFDSVEECFEDLAEHIFALETGLSSDPEMNYRVSSLDRYTLVSSSDTHSPGNLGRQVNIFEGEPGYYSIREGIRRGGGGLKFVREAASPLESLGPSSCAGEEEHPWSPNDKAEDRFVGTIEFYPEQGKYHLDGHRKCSVRLEPEETDDLAGICPVCGKPVTVGVMNRVMQLATRETGSRDAGEAPFWRFLSLKDIIGQCVGVGPTSKRVAGIYLDLLRKIGPELKILWSIPLDRIAEYAPEIITEGISRVRRGKVNIKAGYDGEYGQVRLFTESERDLFMGQRSLLPMEGLKARKVRPGRKRKAEKKPVARRSKKAEKPSESGLNEEQSLAVAGMGHPVVVAAGPGTGKTRTLTLRVATLLKEGKARPEEISAVTFTRKAAAEMRERLERLLPKETAGIYWVGTFHQLGARLLERLDPNGDYGARDKVLDEDEALKLCRRAIKDENIEIPGVSSTSIFHEISLLKQNLIEPAEAVENGKIGRVYRAYENHLAEAGAMDLDDLITKPVRVLRERPADAALVSETITKHLLVDEFQDVNRAQYEMVRLLGGEKGLGLFVIGDPDQAIYGFRGADWRYFDRFGDDYPAAERVRLTRNYRTQAKILKAATDVLEKDEDEAEEALKAEIPGDSPVKLAVLPNSKTEAIFITKTIDFMLGGASFFSMDSNADLMDGKKLSFGDFAVLYRLNAVGDALEEVFESSGLPYQRVRKTNPKEEAEELDPRAEAVTLMTIHASKGLEFPVVFVAGCEDGIIPYIPDPDNGISAEEMKEERRLLYVAMTRAAGELVITRAAKRTLFGRLSKGGLSRFLRSADGAICRFVSPLKEKPAKRAPEPVQGELF